MPSAASFPSEFQACPVCGREDTLIVLVARRVGCADLLGGCGKVWDDVSEFERHCIAKGIATGGTAGRKIGAEYMSDGRFESEMNELIDLVKINTYEYIIDTVKVAQNGRQEQADGVRSKNQIEADVLGLMLSWLNSEVTALKKETDK